MRYYVQVGTFRKHCGWDEDFVEEMGTDWHYQKMRSTGLTKELTTHSYF